jgi:hypothetical protein
VIATADHLQESFAELSIRVGTDYREFMITENQLDYWVRSHEIEARGVIAELMGRLVAASVRNPNDRRFPRADSIGQHGTDGHLDTDIGFLPFFPEGESFWECGTGSGAQAKANNDYNSRTKSVDAAVRKNGAFIFMTPNSGVHGWDEAAQEKWKEVHLKRNEWRDIRIIDGTRLIEWLSFFPSVARWVARKMGIAATGIESPSERWDELRSIGSPPHELTPDLFVENRQAACAKFDEIFNGGASWLEVDTHSRSQMADLVAAHIATLDETLRTEIEGRCVIVTKSDAWDDVVALRDSHILIADFDIDDSDTNAMRMLQRAQKQKHGVVFVCAPGGTPHLNRVSIPEPNEYQVTDGLKKAGYAEGRAHLLARRHVGNLNGLLRSLLGLPSTPEWAQNTEAADLAIAEILGGWNENVEGDQLSAAAISGKEYGEWIGSIREVAQRPSTPLKQRNGVWRFVPRYEGWYALGSRIFDDHLKRLQKVVLEVLSEPDPALELAPSDRYMAPLKGKVSRHSSSLRKGIAETLALLGSHPQALPSATSGKAEDTARAIVHDVLNAAEWVRWASLNDVLPLLAEAAPSEFLAAVDRAVNTDPCPFDDIFAQEGGGFGGRNYMTGLLWGLETLAWHGDYLSRVVLVLGVLAKRDPGGNWGNRPANSLYTILLPWFPQTAASVEKRVAAVKTLLSEVPESGWQLLVNLLPQVHQSSTMTRKPAWRNLIPDDWSEGSSGKDYWDQINAYTTLAVEAAKGDVERLNTLIDKATHLSPDAVHHLISYLRSQPVVSLPEDERRSLWTTVTHLVSQHRRFSTAQWALKAEIVDQFSQVADHLSPNSAMYKHQRLFTDRDFDLYEQNDNFEEEYKKLDERRQKAVAEVYAEGGITRILEMTEIVKSPMKVGTAFGAIGSSADDQAILPGLLGSDSAPHSQFIGGYIWAKSRRVGSEWLDQLQISHWEPADISELLAYLPFTPETWKRAAELLRENESLYWSNARVNPFEAGDDIDAAIDHLIAAGRVPAAIDCIARRIFQKKPINPDHALWALHLAAQSGETVRQIDAFEVVQIIKALQENPDIDTAQVGELEWMFLPLLDDNYGTSAKTLDQRLADDPNFFCDIIRMIFRSKKDEKPSQLQSAEEEARATNADRLLMEWKRLPGTKKDDSFDGAALQTWFDEVKNICGESGHLDVALQRVGHVLRYYPADPEGLFMHRAVAEVLDRRDAAEVRTGFAMEIYNSRGAYAVDPHGVPERELANQYRREAEQLDLQGYTRVASTLREVAAGYDREAEHNVVTARIEDET